MRHVKESSGKQLERWIGSGEAHEFEPLELRKIPSQEVRDPNSQGIKVWTRVVSQPAAGHGLRKGVGPSFRKAEARIPQYADLRFMVLGESLQKHRKR